MSNKNTNSSSNSGNHYAEASSNVLIGMQKEGSKTLISWSKINPAKNKSYETLTIDKNAQEKITYTRKSETKGNACVSYYDCQGGFCGKNKK